MITTTTRLAPVRPEDGTLQDLNPYRRAARLRAGGVRIDRAAPWSYTVQMPHGGSERRRTYASAERAAHAFLDRVPAA